MLDIINTIAGVSGAITGLISVILSILMYVETKNTNLQLLRNDKDKLDSNNKKYWNDLFEKDLMLFNKHMGRAWLVYMLTIYMSAGISYYITNNVIIAAAAFGLSWFILYMLSLPYISYWKIRLRTQIQNSNKQKAWAFAENFASHSWDIVGHLFKEYDIDERMVYGRQRMEEDER